MAMFLTMEAFDGNMWELAGRAVPHAYAGKVAVCLTVPQLQVRRTYYCPLGI
jgi:hypothetical protein